MGKTSIELLPAWGEAGPVERALDDVSRNAPSAPPSRGHLFP